MINNLTAHNLLKTYNGVTDFPMKKQAWLNNDKGAYREIICQEVLDPFRRSIGQQISRAQQFFFSSSQIVNIDHLLLAG